VTSTRRTWRRRNDLFRVSGERKCLITCECTWHNCVISPNRAASECTPPACVDRERLCERLFCEFACFVAYLNYRVSTDSKICGLLSDAVCVNALLLRRVYKVEPKNHLLLVWQHDVERIPVVPPLRLISAAIEALERLSGWGGLRKGKQRRQSNQRKEAPARPQTIVCVSPH
jgi:hypothetical protein